MVVEGELDVGVASAWGVVLLWGIVVLSACPVLGWVDGMLISFSRWSPFACCQWWWRVFWRGFVVSFFDGGFGDVCGVGVDAHNTMGCIMSVWCGIMFVWG